MSDDEVHRVVKQLTAAANPEYDESVLAEPETGGTLSSDGDGDGEQDPLYDQAVQVVMDTRKASISGVQRRLKIGYNRAARMVESMESAGLVGPLQPNGSREILAPAPVKE